MVRAIYDNRILYITNSDGAYAMVKAIYYYRTIYITNGNRVMGTQPLRFI